MTGSKSSATRSATEANFSPFSPPSVPHVTVCICTFRRPALLGRLLHALEEQRTDSRFTFSIVIVDNDAAASARDIASTFAARSQIATAYVTESEQNIARARNRAVALATGEFIAFIDDDEFPTADWLRLMLATCEHHAVSGVLGPVRPHFDAPPPAWVLRGRFCERPEHPTGTLMPWAKSRTGNLMFRRSILGGVAEPFRPQFGTGGEDVDFFARMARCGCVFIWCNEAVAYEVVPPSRCTRRYMLHRALLRGQSTVKLDSGRVKAIATSLIAIPTYLLVLVPALVLGQHVFMRNTIRLCDHVGRLLAFIRLNPVRQRIV